MRIRRRANDEVARRIRRLENYPGGVGQFDVGRLLRLKGAIDSMAGNTKLEPADAASLTQGYARMRDQVQSLVADTSLEAEFQDLFPKLNVLTETAPPGGHGLIEWHHEATSAATQAQRLLNQLGGWVDGLIAEETLPERIQAEAAERVKREQPGFDGV